MEALISGVFYGGLIGLLAAVIITQLSQKKTNVFKDREGEW